MCECICVENSTMLAVSVASKCGMPNWHILFFATRIKNKKVRNKYFVPTSSHTHIHMYIFIIYPAVKVKTNLWTGRNFGMTGAFNSVIFDIPTSKLHCETMNYFSHRYFRLVKVEVLHSFDRFSKFFFIVLMGLHRRIRTKILSFFSKEWSVDITKGMNKSDLIL